MSDHNLVGWVTPPSSRGTLGILYSCAMVIFTAIWTVLHLNVPADIDTAAQTLLRRIRWGIIAIFEPSLLTLVAASQWISARSSVKQMRELDDCSTWTSVHGFYANSGGFLLQPPNEPSFPISAQQIHFLVSRNYIPLPRITREEIRDRSKSDWFAKGFALVQTGWIIIQSIGRTVNGLPVSPLEILTLAFIASTTMTYYFWWDKPQDVKTPTILHCRYSTARILAESKISPKAAHKGSPLDFVQDPTGTWARRQCFKTYDLELDPEANSCKNTRRQRIPNDSILMMRLPPIILAALVLPSLIHCTVLLLDWNFAFPTSTEQLLWRISTIFLATISVTIVGILQMVVRCDYQGSYNLAWVWINPRRRRLQCELRPTCKGGTAPSIPSRTSVQNKAPSFGETGYLDIFLCFLLLCLAIARLFIIVEAIISLRSLPADVFITVEWTELLPHM
ncbi:hypothetical protein F4808DRAFT_449344 [Astrocystis sublimbata]|nr:hypothetical protein F4808DRAFT_449332 [Astrocystis sublimbata]KAI0203428.1 hypothetical protein F4808DRAFT_449344 [Astrocystis sublimbata]